MTKSIKIITIKQENMEVHNFGDRIHDITNEIVEAFKELIDERGKDGVLNIQNCEDLELEGRSIAEIRYANKQLTFVKKSKIAEQLPFWAFDIKNLAWFYDDLIGELKCLDEENK